ncbi:hypothetical protein ACIBCT_20965 [Streptosporangium sp. NPDC050855]|uniref:hypothetical protein n=1 Tax=Streptosporangium sp. NPDC050855 TaxID=3366194 RepID=UPI003798620D
MHRLEREADRMSRFRKGAVYIQISAAITLLITWFTTHEPRLLAAATAALAGAAVARLGARRWAARARWYADTPDWAERIDEAPTVRLFPAFEKWFNAQARTWGGVARILAVPFVVLVLVLVFRDQVSAWARPFIK